MFELYLGLVPGEEPIDRLVDRVIVDPALACQHDDPPIVGDPVTGAVLATIAREPPRAADDAGAPGLWQRLRTRWTSALDAGLPAEGWRNERTHQRAR